MYQLHYEDKKGAGCCKVLKSQEEVEAALKSFARRHVIGILRLQNVGTIGSVEPTSDGVWNWWYDKDIVKPTTTCTVCGNDTPQAEAVDVSSDPEVAVLVGAECIMGWFAWNELQSVESYIEGQAAIFAQEVIL